MKDKIRLVLLVDEEIRDVLRAEHGLSKQEMSDIVAKLVRDNFPTTLKEIRSRRAKEAKSAKNGGGH